MYWGVAGEGATPLVFIGELVAVAGPEVEVRIAPGLTLTVESSRNAVGEAVVRVPCQPDVGATGRDRWRVRRMAGSGTRGEEVEVEVRGLSEVRSVSEDMIL